MVRRNRLRVTRELIGIGHLKAFVFFVLHLYSGKMMKVMMIKMMISTLV